MSSSAINIKGSLGEDALRNQISNASFARWLRGSTFSIGGGRSATEIFFYHTADDWDLLYCAGTAGTTSNNIEVDKRPHDIGESKVDGNPNYFYRLQKGQFAGSNNDQIIALRQRIPNVRKLQNESVTLSFYAKGSSADARLGVGFLQNFGFSGGGADEFGRGNTASSRVFVQGQEVILTNEWKRHKLNFNIPSISGKEIGITGSNFTELNFYLQAGNTTAVERSLPSPIVYAGATFDISNVQLETGVDLSEFENIQANFALAQMVGPRILGMASGTITEAANSIENALGLSYEGVSAGLNAPGATLYINLNDRKSGTQFNDIRKFGEFYKHEPAGQPHFIVSPTFTHHDVAPGPTGGGTTFDNKDIVVIGANTEDPRVIQIVSTVGVSGGTLPTLASGNIQNRPFNLFAMQIGAVGADVMFKDNLFSGGDAEPPVEGDEDGDCNPCTGG